jgi:hypothetical protein
MQPLPKPVVIPDLTHIEVIDSRLLRERNELIVEVRILNADGGVHWSAELRLRPSRIEEEEIDEDGEKRTIRTVRDGQCERVMRSVPGEKVHFHTGTYQSENAYANALAARKAPDEFAALEAAGIADGWLIPLEP